MRSTRSSSTPGPGARGRCSTSTSIDVRARLRDERHGCIPDRPCGDPSTCSSGVGRSSPISSVSRSCAPRPGSLAYCPSKAALAMLTQCIAVDHGPAGVRANCVCPGWVRTPMADREMDWLAGQLDASRARHAYDEVTAESPLRRPSTPEEIAGRGRVAPLRRRVVRQRCRAPGRRRPDDGRRGSDRVREGV